MSKEPGQLAHETFFFAKSLWNSAPGPHKELWARVDAAVRADAEARAAAAEAEAARWKAARDEAREAAVQSSEIAGEACIRAAAAEARVKELEAGLRECADELEWEIRARYGEPVPPAEQRRFERDMAIIVRARALLDDGAKPESAADQTPKSAGPSTAPAA
jgi:hypothetical protein